MHSHIIAELQQLFKCKKCGSCCLIGGDMLVSGLELKRVSRYLQVDPAELISEPSFDEHHLDVRYHLKQLYPCLFYDPDKRLCTIHGIKPSACRKFPFIAVAEGLSHPDVFFLCPGMAEALLRYAGLISDEYEVLPSSDVLSLAAACLRIHKRTESPDSVPH